MSWLGPSPDQDQRDLVAMLDELAADRDLVLTDDPAVVGGLIGELAELGVWTVGAGEEHGGGGADHLTTGLVLERLGRSWPALGWACAQAHAAVDVLAVAQVRADLIPRIHAGEATVAVVEADAPHVDLTVAGGSVTGTVARVDAASAAPHVLVLAPSGSAVLVEPEAVTTVRELRRTGLGGALTREVTVEATGQHHTVIDGVDVGRVRAGLWLRAGAVALGIAAAATDDALAYCSTRHQFGAPLDAIPTVRQSLLDQAARTAVTLRATLAEPTDDIQAWAVLRDACESAIRVATQSLQAHGGYGYLTEYPAERRLRDAISLRAATSVHAAGAAVGQALLRR